MSERNPTGEEGAGPATTVGFQGEPGAYSEEAVMRFFGAAAVPVPYRDFRRVGDAVAAGEVDYGLLPVENTIAGSVAGSYDVLAALDLVVVGEVVAPIRHCLLGLPGADLETVTRILSHPVALAQCTRFLEARPGVEAIAVYDTAGAAKQVAYGGDPACAAIASRRAADRYGLAVLAAGVEDRRDNQTRFFVVAPARDRWKAAAGRVARGAGGMKVALLVETPNEPGALVGVLQPFAERRLNLAKLEARPAPEPWTYRFFIEVEARRDSDAVECALIEVRERADSVRVLGGFPQWTDATGTTGASPVGEPCGGT